MKNHTKLHYAASTQIFSDIFKYSRNIPVLFLPINNIEIIQQHTRGIYAHVLLYS